MLSLAHAHRRHARSINDFVCLIKHTPLEKVAIAMHCNLRLVDVTKVVLGCNHEALNAPAFRISTQSFNAWMSCWFSQVFRPAFMGEANRLPIFRKWETNLQKIGENKGQLLSLPKFLRPFCVFETPFGGLRATYDDHLIGSLESA